MLTARRVRRARKIIAADRCPVTVIRHRWEWFGGIWVRCLTCGVIE